MNVIILCECNAMPKIIDKAIEKSSRYEIIQTTQSLIETNKNDEMSKLQKIKSFTLK